MINIPRLLPIVRQEFPRVPLPQILRAMSAFAQAHPDLNDAQAVRAFQLGLQKARQPKAQQPVFQGLMRQLPTGGK